MTLFWMMVAVFLSLSTRFSCPTYLAIQLLTLFWMMVAAFLSVVLLPYLAIQPLTLFWMMVAAFLSLSTRYSCPTWPSSS